MICLALSTVFSPHQCGTRLKKGMIGLYRPPHRQVLIRKISVTLARSSGRTIKAKRTGLSRMLRRIVTADISLKTTVDSKQSLYGMNTNWTERYSLLQIENLPAALLIE